MTAANTCPAQAEEERAARRCKERRGGMTACGNKGPQQQQQQDFPNQEVPSWEHGVGIAHNRNSMSMADDTD